MELKNKVQKTVMTGVLAALLAVLSQIAIPLPTGIPITLQTFAVALCGYVLGPRLGPLSTAVYLALGAVGLPVFAQFSGGVGSFLGMTGGFLWGFLFLAFLCGVGTGLSNRIFAVLLGIVGLLLCHLCGSFQFAVLTSSGFVKAFLTASAPYLLKDAISVAAAYPAAKAVLLSLKRIGKA